MPDPKMTRSGNGYATVPVPGSDETRYVGVIEWLDGVTLTDLLKQENDDALRKHHFEQVGRFAARMHNQAVNWQMPADFQRHAWDAEGLLGEAPFWGQFWNLPELTPAQREQILHARRTIYQRLLDYGKSSENYSLIHADLYPDNILVDGENVSIIDFDDSGFGWHLYDLAVALYYEQDEGYVDTNRDALISGYRSERSLDDRVDEWLPMFQLVRTLILIGWTHERPEQKQKDEDRLKTLIQRACIQAEAL